MQTCKYSKKNLAALPNETLLLTAFFSLEAFVDLALIVTHLTLLFCQEDFLDLKITYNEEANCYHRPLPPGHCLLVLIMRKIRKGTFQSHSCSLTIIELWLAWYRTNRKWFIFSSAPAVKNGFWQTTIFIALSTNTNSSIIYRQLNGGYTKHILHSLITFF